MYRNLLIARVFKDCFMGILASCWPFQPSWYPGSFTQSIKWSLMLLTEGQRVLCAWRTMYRRRFRKGQGEVAKFLNYTLCLPGSRLASDPLFLQTGVLSSLPALPPPVVDSVQNVSNNIFTNNQSTHHFCPQKQRIVRMLKKFLKRNFKTGNYKV